MSKRPRKLPTDGFDVPVFGRLADVFQHRVAIRKKFDHVKKVLGEIRRSHSPAFRGSTDEYAEIRDLIDDFCRTRIPFAVCPKCRDVSPNRTCICRGRGWVCMEVYSEFLNRDRQV